MMKVTSETNFDQAYTSGNLRKYQSSNPLKRHLVCRMQNLIVELAVRCCSSDTVKILDAGCGEGLNADLLEKRLPNAVITLLDESASALEYARSVCSGRCDFRCGSVTGLPFGDREFDLVICTEVLEHLEKPETALDELLRVSKGFVLISVPDEPWFRIGNMITLKNVKRLGDPTDHLKHWTSHGFRRWIMSCSEGWESHFYHSFPWQFVLLEHGRK